MKKIISLLLAVIMIVGMLPLGAMPVTAEFVSFDSVTKEVAGEPGSHHYVDGYCVHCTAEQPLDGAKEDAIKTINAAAGNNPSKAVKSLVNSAKADINAAETIADVIALRNEWIAEIEKLTGTTHTHTYSENWSCDPYYHWHNATCDHNTVDDFGAHTFGDGVENGNITTYTCTECGYQQKIFNPDGDNEGEIITGIAYTDISLTLGSDISINFYMSLTDSARLNGTMTFNIGGRIVTDVTTKYNETEEKYYFACPLTALELNETVTATFSYKDMDYIQAYSVEEYIEQIVGNKDKYGEKAIMLARKIANYGYYAQIYLASIHDNVVIAESNADTNNSYSEMVHFTTTDEGNVDINVTDAKTALSNYSVTVAGESDTLSLFGTSVYFDSATALNYYVKVIGGTKPTATVVNLVTEENKNVEIKHYKDDIYIVSVKDIIATELADNFIVTVNGELTITGSVLAYCNSVIKAHSFEGAAEKDTFAVDAMAAFYEYYAAAVDYVNSLKPVYHTVTFDMMEHGNQVSSQTVKHGDKVTKPNNPTADDKEFAGWYMDSNYNEKWNFDTDTVTENTTLYANWREKTDFSEYSLCGTINNQTYGLAIKLEDNTYTFSSDGKLTVTLSKHAYVRLRTVNGTYWYYFEEEPIDGTAKKLCVTTYDNLNNGKSMLVPDGQVTFTLSKDETGALYLGYEILS